MNLTIAIIAIVFGLIVIDALRTYQNGGIGIPGYSKNFSKEDGREFWIAYLGYLAFQLVIFAVAIFLVI